MPYTRCPSCGKIQQVVPALASKEIGCMNNRCGKTFKAEPYRMHSNPWSRAVFYFFIAFALFLLFRWIWYNSGSIMQKLG